MFDQICHIENVKGTEFIGVQTRVAISGEWLQTPVLPVANYALDARNVTGAKPDGGSAF